MEARHGEMQKGVYRKGIQRRGKRCCVYTPTHQDESNHYILQTHTSENKKQAMVPPEVSKLTEQNEMQVHGISVACDEMLMT